MGYGATGVRHNLKSIGFLTGELHETRQRAEPLRSTRNTTNPCHPARFLVLPLNRVFSNPLPHPKHVVTVSHLC